MNPELYNSGYHLINPTNEVERLEEENLSLRERNRRLREALAAQDKAHRIRIAEKETVIASLNLDLRIQQEAIKIVSQVWARR